MHFPWRLTRLRGTSARLASMIFVVFGLVLLAQAFRLATLGLNLY
jgi:hypothetical protein